MVTRTVGLAISVRSLAYVQLLGRPLILCFFLCLPRLASPRLASPRLLFVFLWPVLEPRSGQVPSHKDAAPDQQRFFPQFSALTGNISQNKCRNIVQVCRNLIRRVLTW